MPLGSAFCRQITVVVYLHRWVPCDHIGQWSRGFIFGPPVAMMAWFMRAEVVFCVVAALCVCVWPPFASVLLALVLCCRLAFSQSCFVVGYGHILVASAPPVLSSHLSFFILAILLPEFTSSLATAFLLQVCLEVFCTFEIASSLQRLCPHPSAYRDRFFVPCVFFIPCWPCAARLLLFCSQRPLPLS